MKDYAIVIFYSNKDNLYVADIPDLEFCSALGETPEEALREALLAKEAWIRAALASGKKLPQASQSRTTPLW